MKKRALTLIEVMVALGIAAILLAVIFPSFTETLRIKREVDQQRTFIFAKAHVQARLATLFSQSSDLFFEDDKLHITFDHGFDEDPKFRGMKEAILALDQGQLCLSVDDREEILFESIRKAEFTFYSARKGKLIENRSWDSGLPLFLILNITMQNDLSESFYFRLDGTNRLTYPKKST